MTTVGFLGLGLMGTGMAKNLLSKRGHTLVVWNRTTSKVEALKKEFPSVEIASSPKEVVEKCDITYSMMSTLEASEACFAGEDGVLEGVSGGKIIVDCATLTPEHMLMMDAKVTEKGGKFLEAPVSGSKAPAEQGTLIFLAGGDKAVYDQILPDLDAMGKANFHHGGVGKGSQMKIVVNMVMGGMMNCLAEGMALADSCDLSQQDLLSILDLGAMSNPMFKLKGPAMIKGTYPAAFPLKHQQKDMRFAVELGDKVGQTLPVCSAANESFKRARDEFGENDFAAVYEVTKKMKN